MNELQIFESNELERLKEIQQKIYFGYIYVIECEDEVKIGKTTTPYDRINTICSILDKYCNRGHGRIALSIPHTNFSANETMIHNLFSEYRTRESEFFKMSFDEAVNGINNSDIRYLDDSEDLKKRSDEALDNFKKFCEKELFEISPDECYEILNYTFSTIERYFDAQEKLHSNCVYCNPKEGILRRSLGEIENPYELDDEQQGIVIVVFEDDLEFFPSVDDSVLNGYEQSIKINYCPMCGRRL